MNIGERDLHRVYHAGHEDSFVLICENLERIIGNVLEVTFLNHFELRLLNEKTFKSRG
jgi:hypothetical protein